jgi:Ca2+-binding RTX toxin-like protein
LLIVVIAIGVAPSEATAVNGISYVGTTLTVNADPDGAVVEYSALRFFCAPFPCVPPPADYDISSPQAFSSLPPGCSDSSGGSNTDYDCNPVPATTVVNGSANDDSVEASCFLSTSSLVFTGAGGDDTVSSTCANSSLTLGDGGDSATLSGTGTATGGDGDDTIIAGAGTNTLAGDTGKDTLHGGAGDDTVDGGDGNDAIDGDAGNDTLRGGPRRDVLTGGAGTDALEGGDGIDLVSYEDKSGSQPVSISLNGAADDGEPGEGDTVAGDVENAVGSDGPDTITGNADANDLDAGNGSDVIAPGGGPDFVDGGPGDDRVEARDGAQDRIECGDGNDLVVSDEFDTATNCETVQASRELMPDVDNDGIAAPADCQDGNPGVRPGLPDKPTRTAMAATPRSRA